MQNKYSFLSGLAVASAFFLGLGMQSIGTQSRTEEAISSDVREFLSHVSMEDFQIDQAGNTVRVAVISGINLQITNGTDGGPINGAGNLILGDPGFPSVGIHRTGSHNLVGGGSNNWSSWGGIVLGDENQISAPMSSVLGGSENETSGVQSVIVAGWSNQTHGGQAFIGGGGNNVAGAPGVYTECPAVCGGMDNAALGFYSVVAGGFNRIASDDHDFVAGSLWEDQ